MRNRAPFPFDAPGQELDGLVVDGGGVSDLAVGRPRP